eukprot:6948905-Pyramimonas_sp.AAC.1
MEELEADLRAGAVQDAPSSPPSFSRCSFEKSRQERAAPTPPLPPERTEVKVQPMHAESKPQPKGLITTVNATSHGPFFDFLATHRGTILLAQELRITEPRLG